MASGSSWIARGPGVCGRIGPGALERVHRLPRPLSPQAPPAPARRPEHRELLFSLHGGIVRRATASRSIGAARPGGAGRARRAAPPLATQNRPRAGRTDAAPALLPVLLVLALDDVTAPRAGPPADPCEAAPRRTFHGAVDGGPPGRGAMLAFGQVGLHHGGRGRKPGPESEGIPASKEAGGRKGPTAGRTVLSEGFRGWAGTPMGSKPGAAGTFMQNLHRKGSLPPLPSLYLRACRVSGAVSRWPRIDIGSRLAIWRSRHYIILFVAWRKHPARLHVSSNPSFAKAAGG